MEQQKSLSFLKTITVVAAAVLLSILSVFAIRTWAADVIDADVSEPGAGNVFLGLEGRYYADDQAALDRINEIRLEACTAGNVPDPRDPSRMLTEDDYVPIKWSSDLERIARVRAYESALTIAHSRLNGKSIWTVSSNGISSSGEVLAWNWSNTMVSGVNQWYGEKADWVNQNSGAVTGHYTSMIDPSNKYVGLGDFYCTKAQYRNTVSGEFSRSTAALDQTMLAGTDLILQKVEVKTSDYISKFNINQNCNAALGEQIQVEFTADVYIEDQFGGTNSLTMPVLGGVQYQSTNTSVATVDATGLVTTQMAGTTTIKAIIDDDNQFSFDLLVKEYRLNFRELRLSKGVRRACMSYSGPDGEEINGVWTSSNPDVATIEVTSDSSYAWITGKNIGQTTITYTSHDGVHSDSCEVTVVQGLNYKELTLIAGDPGVQLTFTGANGTSTTSGIWTEYDSEIVTVENGFVKPIDEGTTTIWYYVGDGDPNIDYDLCKVTVIKPVIAYEWSADNSKVTANMTSAADGTLIETETAETTCTVIKTPTCEETGEMVYTAVFENSYFEAQTKNVEIPALGHTEIILPGKAATCTENGLTEGKKCSVCGEILAAQEVIPAPGHQEEILPAVPATCTEQGLTEGKKCSVCGEVLIEQKIVPALGHKEEVLPGRAATCTENGLTEGKKCSVCGEILVAQEVIPALGHKEVILPAVPATCTENGLTEGRKCSVCGEILVAQEVIPATGHDWDADGICTRCGEKQPLNGWVKDSKGVWHYYTNDVAATGWKQVSGTWYLFDKTGAMLTGWQKDGGKWYYLQSSGAMATGRVKVGNTWYYMNASGAMQTGWILDGANWYYANGSGAITTGWLKVGSSWYYMNASGVMQTGWVKVGSSWYYMNASGAMQTGWVKVGSSWYYMNASGAMQTGWLKVGNSWYYMNASGAMQTGWVQVGNNRYYMNASGVMQTGWVQVGNTWYYMNASGVMQTGWLKVGSSWYYMNPSGGMQTGWAVIGQDEYYFSSSGVMQTGWARKSNGIWYFAKADGCMREAYVRSVNSNIVHKQTCHYVEQISSKNLQYLVDEKATLKANGYKSCQDCHAID